MKEEKIVNINEEKDKKHNSNNKKEEANNIVNNKDNTSSTKKKHKQKSRNKIKEMKNDSSNKNHHKAKKRKNIRNEYMSQIKTKDTGTINTDSTLKDTQMTNEDKNNFDFYKSIYKIIFQKTNKNDIEDESNQNDEDEIDKNNRKINLINNKIKMIYNLLTIHMKYLKENVLLEKGKLYFFKKIEFFMEKFLEIEKYIINCILLIKFFVYLGDPISLIKANQTLNYLAKELLDYKPKGGLIVHSKSSELISFFKV